MTSILSSLTAFAVLAAQMPVDETNAQSTIIVKKKDPDNTDLPPPPKPPAPPAEEVQPASPVPKPAPPPPPPAWVPAQTTTIEPSGANKVLPWIALGGSIVATGVGAFFAVRTTRAIEEQEELEFDINTSKTKVEIPEEFTNNQRSVFINGITATVLISVGISGAIASTVALTID